MKKTGILLPIAALNSEYGIGDFGNTAYEFVDLIGEIGFKIWQILPLNPLGKGNSPYQSPSSYAGEELYISPQKLYEEGLLESLPDKENIGTHIEYGMVRKKKEELLREAYKNFKKDLDSGYRDFLKMEFVHKYAVYKTLKKKYKGLSWYQWSQTDQNWIEGGDIDLERYHEDIEYEQFVQYMFFKQWRELKSYANKKGIQIMGDIPIYVGLDSLDVWENQKDFLLDEEKRPIYIAGVPPDYFSEDGQIWDNPIYNWKEMERNNFTFWVNRIKHNFKLYDIIRLDHFRGFDTYWNIPFGEKTAKNGHWQEAPSYKFFNELLKHVEREKIVAEDLGFLRRESIELREYYTFKGMRVVQFELEEEIARCIQGEFPRKKKNVIVYTGTHDNQTIFSWFQERNILQKELIRTYFESNGYDKNDIRNAFLEYTLDISPELAIFPLQDIVGLGDEARINIPGTISEKNWSYRFISMEGLREKAKYLKELLRKNCAIR